MKLSWRHGVYVAIIAAALWLAFLSREILTPFVLAAIFAYLLDPAVTFLTEKGKLPRSLSILAVYIVITTLIVLLIMVVGGQLVRETKEFAHEARALLTAIERDKELLPSWLAPYAVDFSSSLKNSINFSSQQIVRFFSGALSSLVSLFVFLLSLFYFLKEGRQFFPFMERLFHGESRIEFAIIANKINRVLGNYLLAQLSLVVLMGVLSSAVFLLLGVRYALILGAVAGLAELLPIFGPSFAFASIIFVATIGGGAVNLPVPFFYQPIITALIYLLLNQLENALVVPQVTGRMVKLHPLLVLLSVMVGWHLFGAVGLLIAVPLVASLKVIFTHVLDFLGTGD